MSHDDTPVTLSEYTEPIPLTPAAGIERLHAAGPAEAAVADLLADIRTFTTSGPMHAAALAVGLVELGWRRATTAGTGQMSERDELAQHLRAADEDYQAREQSANAGRAKDEPGDWWEFMSDAALAWFSEHRTKVLTDAARTIGATSTWSFEQAMEFVTALSEHHARSSRKRASRGRRGR